MLSLQGPAQKSRVWVEHKLSPLTTKVTAYCTGSKWFASIVKKIFDRADLDKNCTLNQAELYVCMLKIYEEVNVRLPTHIKAPSKEEMLKLMKKVDVDQDGELSYPEFLEAAKLMFGASNTDFSLPVHVLVILVLRILFLPLLTQLMFLIIRVLGQPFSVLLWIPGLSVLMPVMLEILIRTSWHSAMDG